MPRKKQIVRGGPPVPRIREESRLMRTHESMVDYLSGRSAGGSFLDALAPAFFRLQFSMCLEDDLIDSDDDDDYYYDDDDDDDYPRYATNKPLEVEHPQIKQLTDEEAKEFMEEEKRRKERTLRNKRKKKRKKEKKRIEKENALKEKLPEEEEEDKLGSSENQEQTCIIDENSEENTPPESAESQTAAEEAGSVELADDTREKDIVKINPAEDEQHKELNLNNLSAASTKLGPEEKCIKKPRKEKKKEKSKAAEVQQPEEENVHVVEKPEVQRKSEHETNKEKMRDPVDEELAKRSIELASMGNRLAASGQYEMAVSCFTDAIKYNPKEFKLFGNRSLCYERLQHYENALRDADLALSMEPNWIKGLFRKGKALCGLKRYYEASLIYKDVLSLESTSDEAARELKRAQTLHLMEMGFSWAQSTEALKTHATLEEAVEALFASRSGRDPEGAHAIGDRADQPLAQEEDHEDDHGEWTVLQTTRPRTQQVRDLDCLGQIRSQSQSPTPRSRSSGKPELFSVWVGTLGPAMTYPKLHELFSRVGRVYSIKMLLEQQCAFVNYTRKDECEQAIQCLNGMVVEGAPLTVRYPFKNHTGEAEPFRASPYKKECFFWRTTGCTRDDCTYRHIPENKNIDRDKFTSRLGFGSYAGNQK
uniref:Si:dkey-33c12.4 n=2 Tax=Fundulus heteroclitus TaxID=8078 RepID=A0A3Q2NYG3_FUNHE